MADQELREAFNDCIDRLATGQSLGDCLRQYPQHARELRAMLEVGGLVERAQAAPAEVSAAQARVRERIRQRAYVPPRSQVPYRAALLVASLALAFVATFAAAENSLPGDGLYGLKRLEESARGAITHTDFASRRLDEIRALLAFRREAVVEFSGAISAQDGANWRIAGLDVQTDASTEVPQPIRVGDTVRVSARTTAQGTLVAQRITLLERALPTPSPTVPTIAPTTAPTETATPTGTATPAPSATATFSATPVPTDTPSPTATPTRTNTQAPTAPPASTDTPVVCAPAAPDGWVRYTIQSGDTVAGLAFATGTTVEQLIAVNCVPDNLMIIVGQRIFLPSLPAARATAVPQVVAPTAQPTDDHGGSSGSGDNSGSGDDHGGSSGSSDNSGSGDDHGGNSGSG